MMKNSPCLFIVGMLSVVQSTSVINVNAINTATINATINFKGNLSNPTSKGNNLRNLFNKYNSFRTQSLISLMQNDNFAIQNMFKNMCNLTELIQLLGTRAVVFTETSVRLENALKNCKEHKKYFQSVEIHGKNLSLLTTEMLWLRKTELKVFLILTSLETASIILEIALRHNIFNSDFIWILPHPTISVTTLMKLPDVVFLIDINGSYQSISCPNYVFEGPLVRNQVEYIGYQLNSTTKKWKPVLSKHVDNPLDISDGLYLRLPYLYKNHMRNKPYRVVTIIDPPFIIAPPHLSVIDGKCSKGHLCLKTEFVNNTKIKIAKCCIGLCIDLLTMFEVDLDITTELYLVEDGFYGSKVKGVWIGMIGDILQNKSDFIVAAIIASKLRESAVDFSEPYMSGGMALATVAMKENYVLWSGENSDYGFSGTVWISVLFLTIISATLVSYLEYRYPRNLKYNFSEALLFFTGLTFQRDLGGSIATKFSSQLIAQSVAMFMIVAISTYTAVITANIVTHETVLPLTGFADKKMTNPSEDFIYGVENNTSYDDKFRTSSDPTWNHMHTFMKRHAFKGVLDGVQKLKEGKLHAIITDYYVLKYYMALEPECQIQFAGKEIPDVGYGIVVPQGSPMKNVFSALVLKYKDNLFIERLKEKWFSNVCDKKKPETPEQTGPVYFQNIFYACTVTIGISVLLLIIEYIMNIRRVSPQHQRRI